MAAPSVASGATRVNATAAVTAACEQLSLIGDDLSDREILNILAKAQSNLDRAAKANRAYSSTASALRELTRAIRRNDDSGAVRALLKIQLTCQDVAGIDVIAAWQANGANVVATPPPPPQTAPPATAAPLATTTTVTPIAIAPPQNAPLADPRNSAVNQELPNQNSGVPWNFVIPFGFSANYDLNLPGRAYLQPRFEDINGLLTQFRNNCLAIGWPVLRIDAPKGYVTATGVNGIIAGVTCRSADGGGPGQAAPWILDLTIITFPNSGTYFNSNLHR